MKQTIFIFGGISILMLLLFQLSNYSLIHQQLNLDIYITIFGLLFITIGLLLSRLFKPNTPRADNKALNNTLVPQKEDKNFSQVNFEETGLSEREYEILLLIAEGNSNFEIADKLFISENTVKTHVSKILTKLNAKRRTQAVQIARELEII